MTDLELGVELLEGEVVQRQRRRGIGFGSGAGPGDLGEEGDGRHGDDGCGAGAPEREEGHCDAVGRVCGVVRLGNRHADDGGKRRESSRGVWIRDHARGRELSPLKELVEIGRRTNAKTRARSAHRAEPGTRVTATCESWEDDPGNLFCP